MGDVDALVAHARDLVVVILSTARLALSVGADVSRVHDAVARAGDYLRDIETYAVLARRDSYDAEAAIEERIRRLEDVRRALKIRRTERLPSPRPGPRGR